MWLVMKVRRWDSVEGYLNGSAIPIQMAAPTTPTGSVGFMEVFKSREAALAAADGKADLVREVKEVSHA